MTMPVFGHLYRVVLHAADGASRFNNVRWYEVVGVAGGGASHAAVANSARLALLPAYFPLFSTAVQAVRVTAQLCTSAGLPIDDEGSNATGLPTAGSSAGDQMPSYVSGVLSLRTGLVGARLRGRLFTWPAGESANSPVGTPEPAWVSLANLFGAALRAPLVAGTAPDQTSLEPVVLSRVGGMSTPLASVLVRDEWGTMRLRKRGRGI